MHLVAKITSSTKKEKEKFQTIEFQFDFIHRVFNGRSEAVNIFADIASSPQWSEVIQVTVASWNINVRILGI